jgi:uncharacterized protein (DUF58 family)
VRALVLGLLVPLAGLLLRRPDLVVLGAPFLLLGVAGGRQRPRQQPSYVVQLRDRFVPEGRGTVLRTTLRGCAEIEQITRLVTATPYVATRPVAGAVGSTPTAAERAAAEVHTDVALASRRGGVRTVGEGRVAATSAWGGYRWGPVSVPSSLLTVLPARTPFDSRAEAPHPLGLIGVNRSRRQGSGTEFAGIRPFATGDRLRRIHWRTSLRTGELHVVTTTAEEDTAVLLLVDATTDVGVSGGIDGTVSSLDATVRAAGALAEHHLRIGNRVSLRVLGQHPALVPIGAGSRHRQRILETLARVQPGDPDEFDPSRLQLRLGAGTVVLVLSPLLSAALTTSVVTLARKGLAVVAVDTLPPGAIGEQRSSQPDLDRLAWRMRMLERRLQLTEIARTGTPVVAWRGPGSLDDVLHRLARRARLPRAALR